MQYKESMLTVYIAYYSLDLWALLNSRWICNFLPFRPQEIRDNNPVVTSGVTFCVALNCLAKILCLLLQIALVNYIEQTETFVCLKTHLLVFSLVRHISNDWEMSLQILETGNPGHPWHLNERGTPVLVSRNMFNVYKEIWHNMKWYWLTYF